MALGNIIGAAAGSMLGGVMGGRASQEGYGASEAMINDLLSRYRNLQLPDIEQMKLALEQYQSQGALSPQQEAMIQAGPTAFEQITLSPQYQQAAEQALQQMAGMSKTGLNEIDRAALEEALRKSAAEAESSRKAVLESQAARGMGGSGSELAAALAGSQSAANKANDEAMKTAAMSAQRRMDATSQAANLAQALQQSQYQRASDLAGRKDVIEQFNKQLQTGTQQRNVSAANQAQAANLAAAQNIANANVGLRNQQQQYNRSLAQQQFQNELSRLGGMGGAVGMGSQAATSRGQAGGTMWAGIGSGLGQVLGNINYGGSSGGKTVPDTSNMNMGMFSGKSPYGG